MTSKRDLRRLLGPVRDFACAFALFFGMAYVLVADKTYPFPPAMLSLMSGGAMLMSQGFQVGPSAAPQKIRAVPSTLKKIVVTPKNPT